MKITLYKMEEIDGQYILVGEIYQEKFEEKFDQTYKILIPEFIGNNYTHYSVIAIDNEGKTT